MANRPQGYGYSKEVSNRINAKYSDDDEMEVVAWINSILKEDNQVQGKQEFHSWLKSGHVLCSVMNALEASSCNPNTDNPNAIPAMKKNKEMENIGMFLKAAEDYGLSKLDLFQTVDLYEATNLAQVQVTLYKLSAAAMQKGYDGPQIGVKIAEKNIRQHDDTKVREGRNVIGLQMGTNQVASQEGMTPYGLGRQLTPQTK